MASSPVSSDERDERYIDLLRRLSGEKPSRGLLTEIVDALLDVLRGERAFLFRLRRSGGFRVLVARNRDRERVTRPGERMSHHAVSRMLRSGELFHVPDARRDRRYRAADAREGLKPPISLMVIPFHIQGELAAGLYVDHRFHQLDEEEARNSSVERWLGLCALALSLREQAARLRWLESELASRRRRERVLRSPPEGEVVSDREGPGKHGREPGGRPGEKTAAGPEAAEARSLVEFHGLQSSNPDMLDLFDTLRNIRDADIPVLVLGETGAGKSLLARAVHRSSKRAAHPFITVSCGVIPESLVESELLGHARGAFTGAETERVGLLCQANQGTLFLDEVGDMTPAMQKMLLRVLEDGKVRPLGGKETIDVDLRIVASTSHDLELLVRRGSLRNDLYFRIKGLVLELPSLRERWEDIPLLADRFLQRYARTDVAPKLESEAVDFLVKHSWPGNVRELENEMRRLATLGYEEVGLKLLSPELVGAQASGSHTAPGKEAWEHLDEVVTNAERRAIVEALRRSSGNKSQAARQLGITRKALYRRLSKYGLGTDSG